VILLGKLLLEDNNIYNQSDIGSINMKQRHPFLELCIWKTISSDANQLLGLVMKLRLVE
jgi:hypothetical protein